MSLIDLRGIAVVRLAGTRAVAKFRPPSLDWRRALTLLSDLRQAPELGHRGQLFLYILLYRWLSLLPPLLSLALHPAEANSRTVLWVLGSAAGYNVVITALHPRLNHMVLSKPPLLGLDILICTAFMAASGGLNTPYYLYALSPLFGAGLFFRIRGSLTAAVTMAIGYIIVTTASVGYQQEPVNVGLMSIQIAGFFLIAGLFANFASLLEDQRTNAVELERIRGELERKTVALERSNRDLRSLHALSVALQSAAVHVHDVQRRVLTMFTRELGYPRALIGLLDHGDYSLTAWMEDCKEGRDQDPTLVTIRIPVTPEGGPLAESLGTHSYCLLEDEAIVAQHPALSPLRLRRGVILPLMVREVPVGVLVVETEPGQLPDEEGIALLNSVAHQSALAIWSTRMCMERAHRTAVQEERNRVAREIHDTVLQSLFGTIYIVESCLKLMPEDEHAIRGRLEAVLRQSTHAMSEIRSLVHDMWIGGMTTGEFASELRSYLDDIGKPAELDVKIEIEGDITELTPFTRKHLFRITQEALANVVRHAHAKSASVHLSADAQYIRLSVRDDGRGFDPSTTQGMGLTGMRERAQAIGGNLEIRSQPMGGTTIELRLPRLSCIPSPQLGS